MDERKFVTALARGLDVLRCFGPDDALLGNRDIAERTGLPKATISRLAYTLTELGYLRFDPGAGKYALDAGVLALGYAFLSSADILVLARPHMRALAHDMGCAISLGCRDGMEMMYLETLRSETALTLGLTVGSRLSMLTSSMGRAYLAVLPAAERREVMAALRERHPDDWDTLSDGVDEAIATYAREGCCYSFQEWHADVNAVAVPLRDTRQHRWLAISCSGPASISREKFRECIGPKLRALAARLGR